MGTFLHPITLIGESGERVTVDALVDTGATFTTMPSKTLQELGILPRRFVRLRLADGRTHEQPLGYMTVEVDGFEGPTYVVFGPEGAPASIGAITLEGFLLGVDPVAKRLVSVEGWQAEASMGSLQQPVR